MRWRFWRRPKLETMPVPVVVTQTPAGSTMSTVFAVYRRKTANWSEGEISVIYTKEKGQGTDILLETLPGDTPISLGVQYGLTLTEIPAGGQMPPVEVPETPDLPEVCPPDPGGELPEGPQQPIPGYPVQLPIYPGYGPSQPIYLPTPPPGWAAQLPVFPDHIPSQPIYLPTPPPGYPVQLPIYPGYAPSQPIYTPSPGVPAQPIAKPEAPEQLPS